MDEKPAFTLIKPSFWRSEREIKDRSNAKAGFFKMTGYWGNAAEGEAHGRRFKFGTESNWDNRYIHMTDMSGQRIATLKPVGWWGTQYQLTYAGIDYSWKTNGWGTTFSILKGDREIVHVRPGGYFKPGGITVREMPEKDALPLALFGLFQMQIYSANAASASSVVHVAT